MANDILSNKNNLAIEEGTPVRKELLPYGKQFVEQKDINAVIKVLESDWLTTGPTVMEFEKQFAEQVGTAYTLRCDFLYMLFR